MEDSKNKVLKENEQGFVEDPRYKTCDKEAWYGVILGLINLIIWAVAGYGLGSGNVESYSYIMGFPAWFFWSCIANSIFAILGTIYLVKKKMENMKLEPLTVEEAEAYVQSHQKGAQG